MATVTVAALLTVAGEVALGLDAAVAAGRHPRADLRAMSSRIPADLLDHAISRPARRPGGILRRLLGADVLLARSCARRASRYDVVVTDSERVGLPVLLALLLASGRDSAPILPALLVVPAFGPDTLRSMAVVPCLTSTRRST